MPTAELTPTAEMKPNEALRPIDCMGLTKLVDKNKANPAGGKVTLKATTVTEGQMRNLTYIRDLAPTVIDEPPHLLGENTAPNPSEAVSGRPGRLPRRRLCGERQPPWHRS